MMELNRIHHGSALALFASLPESPALIVADPPYGIGYQSGYKTKISKQRTARGADRTKTPRTAVGQFNDTRIDVTWLKPAYQSLQEEGAMYLFTRWDVLHHWHAAALEAGFKVPQCLIWDKELWGAGDLRYYGSQTENILFCIKSGHQLRWTGRRGNVLRVARGIMLTRDTGGRHPTQKPVDLMKKIIAASSDVDDLVVDPFTGSGAACIAAQRLHRRFIGTDIDPAFAAAAQAWIEQDAATSSDVRQMLLSERGN